MTSAGRRHFGPNSRPGCCVMESLAEAEAETEADGEIRAAAEATPTRQTAPLTRSSRQVMSQNPPNGASSARGDGRSSRVDLQVSNVMSASSEDAVQKPGCTAPFFGVKHYLHNFYGLPQYDETTKVWQQIHSDVDDNFDLSPMRSVRKRQRCGRLSRLCFGYSICLGVLMTLLGITCLLLGYLLPRHQIIAGQVEEQDLKLWIAQHQSSLDYGIQPNSRHLNIVDNEALEYNNLLDLMKIGGLIAVCLGCLVIVTALIFPTCKPHKSTLWHEDDDDVDFGPRPIGEEDDDDDYRDEHSTKLSQALRNCLRSFHLKTHSTVFYSGLVASNNDKIPVLEQLKSVQPTQ